MDTRVAREMIRVIRAERDSRLARLTADPELDSDLRDIWSIFDEPVINELCFLLLVAIWHEVERELAWLAARVTSDGKPLTVEEYHQRVKELGGMKPRKRWGALSSTLSLDTFPERSSSMKTLQILANKYKHDPFSQPDEKLLKHLNLPLEINGVPRNYAPLTASQDLKEGLVASLDLPNGADYCDISEALLARAERFLKEVQAQLQAQSKLSPIKRGTASLKPKDFLH